jgi:hypothetical protein
MSRLKGKAKAGSEYWVSPEFDFVSRLVIERPSSLSTPVSPSRARAQHPSSYGNVDCTPIGNKDKHEECSRLCGSYDSRSLSMPLSKHSLTMIQALRANTISRPVSLLKTAGASAVAGPSTCRYYASTADVPPTATSSLDASAPIKRDLLESSVATPPKSARLQGQLPPNVVFEGFEEGEGIEPKKEMGGCES